MISHTAIDGLDIVVSNDFQGQLPQLLLNAPDGRFRLSHLLGTGALADYDVVLIDTQGARSITLEAAVLASDHLLSPITPDLLSAREFVRGTIGMLDELETLTQYTSLSVPPLSLLLNRLDETRSAKDISRSLRSMFDSDMRVQVMEATFRLLAAFKQAGAVGVPIHRFEPVKPYISQEMPEEQLMLRLLASVGSLSLQKLRTGKLEDEDWLKLTAAVARVKELEGRLFIDDESGISASTLKARARRLARRHWHPSLILIDYLQLLHEPGGENRNLEISTISRILKEMAKDLRVPPGSRTLG